MGPLKISEELGLCKLLSQRNPERGQGKVLPLIIKALEDCKQWEKRRVRYFQQQLHFYKGQKIKKVNEKIDRKQGNPYLRHNENPNNQSPKEVPDG